MASDSSDTNSASATRESSQQPTWQIARKGRPILMEPKSSTPCGTKKSQGRDFKIPTEERSDPHVGTEKFLPYFLVLDYLAEK